MTETELVNVAIVRVRDTELALECIGDQIIVLEDKFKTGYECSKCDGEGYTDEECDFCKGTGKENVGTERESLCRICCPRNLVDSGMYSPGKKVCELCKGMGATIVAPQSSERKPTSGIIKSVGPDVLEDTFPKHWLLKIVWFLRGKWWSYPMKVGDRVLYSQFAGTGINLRQKDFIRIMHAHEVMCRIYGSGKLGDFVK